MAGQVKFGKRIRRLRERLGLTQVAMARRLGLSASYLNLIEHDQRPLTPKLSRRMDEAFDVELETFSATEAARTATDLLEVLSDPVFGGRAMAEAEIRDGIGASGDLGRAMLDLYRAYRAARDVSESLGEELRNREILAAINYEFRSIVTSIRSFAEILQDNPDLDLEQRRRFIDIIVDDSKRLVPLFGGLLDLDAVADGPADRRLPIEDVGDFLQSQGGHVAQLEDVAEATRAAAGIERTATNEQLAAGLAREQEGRRLAVPEMLSPEMRLLAIAKALAIFHGGERIAQVADAGHWASAEARSLAVSTLADYVAAALLMPYDSLLAAARELRHDIERLQRRFRVGFEQVCRRLTALQRPGAKGVPFHLIKVDMAGNVTGRLGGSGFRVPRFGGVCSLWNVHAAFLTPGVTRTQLSRMPDGATYFSFARAIRAEEPETVGSPRFSAIELGCDVAFARDIVYADGLELGVGAAAVPVGTTCRLCERPDCTARVLPPLRQPTTVAAGVAIR